MNVAEYILIAFPAIFVILNPFSSSTSFISMTMNHTVEDQLKIAKKACWTAFIGMVVFALAGHLIFQLFQITVEAFRIAGGIILFQVGTNMMKLKPLRIKQTEEEEKESLKRQDLDIGIVPLGIPIMCGPGTITTVIVMMTEINWKEPATGILQATGLILSAGLCSLLFYFILINARKVLQTFKVTGIGVMTRIMGLMLTVIATQFVINGMKGLIPKLAPLLLQS
ncbi:MAG: MarC family protein [Deltaproteobacteria bacterium]|nr:MarC family protein [Deltaproteobacteria bacterium]